MRRQTKRIPFTFKARFSSHKNKKVQEPEFSTKKKLWTLWKNFEVPMRHDKWLRSKIFQTLTKILLLQTRTDKKQSPATLCTTNYQKQWVILQIYFYWQNSLGAITLPRHSTENTGRQKLRFYKPQNFFENYEIHIQNERFKNYDNLNWHMARNAKWESILTLKIWCRSNYQSDNSAIIQNYRLNKLNLLIRNLKIFAFSVRRRIASTIDEYLGIGKVFLQFPRLSFFLFPEN